MKQPSLLIVLFLINLSVFSQISSFHKLAKYDEETIKNQTDWLTEKSEAKAQLFQNSNGELVFSNGIISRVFTLSPNGACIGLQHLGNRESFLRSVRPEAIVKIDGMSISVGGLIGQPIHNYLLHSWIKDMKSDPSSFQLVDYKIKEPTERFAWKKRLEWMPYDLPWPLPGKEVVFSYQLNEQTIEILSHDTSNRPKDLAYLKDIIVNIHYEIYDGYPIVCKWLSIDNYSKKTIQIDNFTSEILATVEPRNEPQLQNAWMLPNITIQTDYDCGGGMQFELGEGKSYKWTTDSLYKTQINWQRENPCLLVVKPVYGPAQSLEPNKSFVSYRVWELIHSSRERERKGLELRKMFRGIAPWVTENPIMMHARYADTPSVKKIIDQCATVGFEKIILTFGSGFNIEDDSKENIERMKMLADYAHSKGVTLGGYSLLASRNINKENNVVMPQGMKPTFGNSPCLCSDWGEEYYKKLYHFFETTGFDNLEHDGSYPGDICISTKHPGHKGLADSRWNQFHVNSKFYHWCRSKGIFLNVPDWYFLNGSNKCGMGYRETNWSLPRAQQEIIERQNIYDGTWFKTPSMGWMHIPLTEYHGGGEEATYMPLHSHLESYEQRLANLFGAGVQAAWRGTELYDTQETKELVKKWVDFYKKHRQILDADIIHIRRPDGQDYDAILHVDPFGEEKALLMVYNPLNKAIKRKIKVNLYYSGLSNNITVREQDAEEKTFKLDRNYDVWIDVSIPAHSQTWFVIKSYKNY